jgi:hypothetical protein
MEKICLKSTKALKAWFLRICVSILLSTVFGGCLANFGNYNRDSEVFQAFTTDQVPSDYRYYYYHSGSEPIAVIGVDKKYDAGSKMWRDIEPNTEKFREMIHWIWEDFGYSRFGAKINDPSGMQVGIMYTSVREVAFKFTDDNRIIVMPNTPFLWGELGEEGEDLVAADTNSLPSDRQQALR